MGRTSEQQKALNDAIFRAASHEAAGGRYASFDDLRRHSEGRGVHRPGSESAWEEIRRENDEEQRRRDRERSEQRFHSGRQEDFFRQWRNASWGSTRTQSSYESCWSVLGIPKQGATKASIGAAYKRKARELHPDLGGTHEQMVELNKARAEAMASL